MKSKHYLLLCLVPLSEAKALFYNYDTKVAWYLFSNNKRYLCNVVEDYANVAVFAILLYHLAFTVTDATTKAIARFLFVINLLDLVHLGLMDMQYLVAAKLAIASIVTLCTRSKQL